MLSEMKAVVTLLVFCQEDQGLSGVKRKADAALGADSEQDADLAVPWNSTRPCQFCRSETDAPGMSDRRLTFRLSILHPSA